MGFELYFLAVYLASVSLLTIVGVPQPFSVPPLPEDPALLRIVPKDPLLAATWSGTAPADAHAGNITERLCAEPELRASLAALLGAVQTLASREMGGSGLASRGLDLAVAALSHPGCAFLRDLSWTPQPKMSAGIACKLDGELRTAKAMVGALGLAMQAAPHGPERHEDIEVDDVRFHALPTDTDHPFLGWAEVDGWFLLAIGDDVPARMVAGLRGTDEGLAGQADYQRLAAATAVARPSTRTFVDCKRLIPALVQQRGERIAGILKALGLGSATAAVATTGLDGDGFCCRCEVATAERTGLLGAFATSPIAQDSLLAVPVDADVALAINVDPAAAERAVIGTFAALFGDDVERGFERFERACPEEVGVSWREFVGQFDGQIAAWNAPSQGGLGFTAATARFGLRNHAAFAQLLATVEQRIAQHVPAKADLRARDERLSHRGTWFESLAHGDRTIRWLDVADVDFPFAPSWAAAPAGFVIGLWPQSVTATLDALEAPNPDRSLARLPMVNKRGNAAALLYLDLPGLARTGWPMLTMLFQASSGRWQRDGFDFDAADLPRLSALMPHLRAEVSRLQTTATGCSFTRTGTVPVFDPLTVTAILVASTWLTR